MDADEIKEFGKMLNAWDAHYAAAVEARDAARAATAVKEESRDALEEMIRMAAKRIQADNRISNHARAEAGLPIHKTKRTPVAVPKTSPITQIIASDRLEHSIMFSDASTPTRRARPAGCTGVEVYVAIADQVPQGSVGISLHGSGHSHASSAEVQGRRRRQAGSLSAALGQHQRRNRPVGPDRQRDHSGGVVSPHHQQFHVSAGPVPAGWVARPVGTGRVRSFPGQLISRPGRNSVCCWGIPFVNEFVTSPEHSWQERNLLLSFVRLRGATP